MQDLVHASGYAALVYLMFSYMISFGSGRPLVEWINPGRRFLPIMAGGLFGLSYTMLIRGVYKYQESHFALLKHLVTDEKAQMEVVGAVMFLMLGLSIMMLFLWCWWNLPRDPQTFSPNPKNLVSEYRRALRHYVRWKGGLDYAFLCELPLIARENDAGTILAEGMETKSLLRGLKRILHKEHLESAQDDKNLILEQKQIWQEEAKKLFADMPRLDELVKPVRQGHNVAVCFDLRYGAIYFELIDRLEGATEDKNRSLYLFAVSLNQHEVTNMNAARHFYSLSEAIRHIRRGVSR